MASVIAEPRQRFRHAGEALAALTAQDVGTTTDFDANGLG
jgi:hypothetical protein